MKRSDFLKRLCVGVVAAPVLAECVDPSPKPERLTFEKLAKARGHLDGLRGNTNDIWKKIEGPTNDAYTFNVDYSFAKLYTHSPMRVTWNG